MTNKDKNVGGRPTIYSKKLEDIICERIALGSSLRSICKEEDMPAMSSVFKWLREVQGFSEHYENACGERTEAQREEILDISDGGIEIIKKSAEKKSSAIAQIIRLQVDSRKWLMSKMKPKKYGDKLDLTSGGEKLPTPIYGGISKHNGNSKGIRAQKKD